MFIDSEKKNRIKYYRSLLPREFAKYIYAHNENASNTSDI